MRNAVLPLTREWIEIIETDDLGKDFLVLPLTREWIEISIGTQNSKATRGSPSHEGVD